MIERARAVWSESQAAKIIVLCGIAAVLFTGTLISMRAFQRYVRAVSQHAFQRAETKMQQGNAAAAVQEYRTALVYARENPDYRLKLGEALASAHRDQEAVAYLKGLWDREPGSGEINLQLARLMERVGNKADASEYYQNAIYGIWESDPEMHRRVARLEFSRFLLKQHQYQRAEAELLALLPEIPDDAASQMTAGDLFLEAGDARHALEQYERVLRREPSNANALAGAGQAAFQLANYDKSVRYLGEVVKQKHDPALEVTLEVAKAAVELDPYQRRLTLRGRSERVARAFEITGARLKQCVSGNLLAANSAVSDANLQWESMKSKASVAALRRDPDFQDDVLRFVYGAEQLAAGQCGEGTPEDQALLLMAKEREGATR
jgi:tetratricopeptide (TPR) repeat protein